MCKLYLKNKWILIVLFVHVQKLQHKNSVLSTGKGLLALPEFVMCSVKNSFEQVKSADTKFTSWTIIVHWKLHWRQIKKSGGR